MSRPVAWRYRWTDIQDSPWEFCLSFGALERARRADPSCFVFEPLFAAGEQPAPRRLAVAASDALAFLRYDVPEDLARPDLEAALKDALSGFPASQAGSVTASCGHQLVGSDGGQIVQYAGQTCDAVEGFRPCTETALFCAVCAEKSASLSWAVGRWMAEVLNRPLHNTSRRPLDDAWRQVIRHHGGDPAVLLPLADHDTLLGGATAQVGEAS